MARGARRRRWAQPGAPRLTEPTAPPEDARGGARAGSFSRGALASPAGPAAALLWGSCGRAHAKARAPVALRPAASASGLLSDRRGAPPAVGGAGLPGSASAPPRVGGGVAPPRPAPARGPGTRGRDPEGGKGPDGLSPCRPRPGPRARPRAPASASGGSCSPPGALAQRGGRGEGNARGREPAPSAAAARPHPGAAGPFAPPARPRRLLPYGPSRPEAWRPEDLSPARPARSRAAGGSGSPGGVMSECPARPRPLLCWNTDCRRGLAAETRVLLSLAVSGQRRSAWLHLVHRLAPRNSNQVA